MKPFLKHWLYPVTVFITGACVLIVEVVAVRMLSPYFGNTIYTFSSVISVILLALSSGYYFGGKLADQHPKPTIYFSTVVVSGATLALLYAFSKSLLQAISESLPLTYGPLVTTALLFLLPALLIGVLSPFAVRLQSDMLPKSGIGTVSGRISFFSTAGSIFGSLLAGFVLIPQFGIHRIFVSVAIFLMLTGLAGLVLTGAKREFTHKVIIFCMLAASIQMLGAPTLAASVIYQKDGVYERLSVSEGKYKERPVRFFTQDRSNSSAMYLDSDDPKDLVFEYSRYYRLVELFQPKVERTVTLGGGVYSIPKAMLAQYPNAQVEAVEIESRLEEIAKEYFALPNDKRLSLHTEDGRRYLKTSKQTYDLIFSDVYSSLYSLPSHFATEEFFGLASSKLSGDGLFMANIIGDLSRSPKSLVPTLVKTAQRSFKQVYLIAVISPYSMNTQNFILVGTNSDKTLDPSSPAVRSHDSKTIRDISQHLVDLDRYNFDQYTSLTDDYMPTDNMSAALLRRSFDGEGKNGGSYLRYLIDQQLSYGDIFNDAEANQKLENFLRAELGQSEDVSLSYGKDIHVVRLNPKVKNRVAIMANYGLNNNAPEAVRQLSLQRRASALGMVLELRRQQSESKSGIDFIFVSGDSDNDATKALKSLYQKHTLTALINIESACNSKDGLNLFTYTDNTISDMISAARPASADESFLHVVRRSASALPSSLSSEYPVVTVADAINDYSRHAECSIGHMNDALNLLQGYLKKS